MSGRTSPVKWTVARVRFDAVDGSSTGTEMPSMWVLLRPPPFGGAKHPAVMWTAMNA
jgi:hypothetical protein